MKSLFNDAIEAVKKAGEIILDSEIVRSQIIQKGFGNYVTQVDLKVQEFLVGELDQLIPGSNIITEESTKNQFTFAKPTWILDPVDGTTNLMRGYRFSAVSLALFDQGKPAFGIIFNPFADELFTAESGKGAFLNGKDIHVTQNSELEDCLIAFGTAPYHRNQAEKTFRLTEAVFVKSLEIRRSGSAALDLVYTACGRLDGYYEFYLQPWDFAAGMIILEEAGGRICDWGGSPLNALTPGSVLATNGFIHHTMLEMISPYKK